jgi:V8-like Glu-specific endopeptidase
MRRFSLFLNFLVLIICFIGCSACLSSSPQPPKSTVDDTVYITENAQHLDDATVALIFQSAEKPEEGYKIFCSGVFINTHQILTARHCAAVVIEDPLLEELGLPQPYQKAIGHQIAFKTYEEKDEFFKPGRSKSPYYATIVAMGEEDDVALLELNDSFEHDYIPVAAQNPAIGSEFTQVGHPARYGWTMFTGYVSAMRELDGKELLHVTSPSYYGSSGGPAIQNGHVVGICSMISTRVPNMTWLVPTDRINLFLAKQQPSL